ncbi:unnamed protein product [Adineta steineri]|uniref:Uncharacterized protein n=1 Tax=Adineta steineri TaxID=433720 RepID=A0A813N3L0_9BILA|nr:unnamed protein product [Adineta steineri]CAF3506346.1 unnamed protein product [Adineta steineri]CAF3592207.1 unnamed protein product [Adineta steineri]
MLFGAILATIWGVPFVVFMIPFFFCGPTSIFLIVWWCIILRKKFVTVYGTFGSKQVKFNKPIAREFEARLSEFVYLARARDPMAKTNISRPQPQHTVPAYPSYSSPSGPSYYAGPGNTPYYPPPEKDPSYDRQSQF